MAIAPVLKTGVRKDIRVRIPGPPLDSAKRTLRRDSRRVAAQCASERVGAERTGQRAFAIPCRHSPAPRDSDAYRDSDVGAPAILSAARG